MLSSSHTLSFFFFSHWLSHCLFFLFLFLFFLFFARSAFCFLHKRHSLFLSQSASSLIFYAEPNTTLPPHHFIFYIATFSNFNLHYIAAYDLSSRDLLTTKLQIVGWTILVPCTPIMQKIKTRDNLLCVVLVH